MKKYLLLLLSHVRYYYYPHDYIITINTMEKSLLFIEIIFNHYYVDRHDYKSISYMPKTLDGYHYYRDDYKMIIINIDMIE